MDVSYPTSNPIGVSRTANSSVTDDAVDVDSNPVRASTADWASASDRRTAEVHRSLAWFNARRLAPGQVSDSWERELDMEYRMRLTEGRFLEQERRKVRLLVQDIPNDPEAFVMWFEGLKTAGPGQGDPLFTWLADKASMEQMRWFLTQEAAGEAGFDDLVAMAQVKLPTRPKLEMARNYWDEMGRGHERGMHGPMLSAVVEDLDLRPTIENTIWQSLALANLMVGLATNRRYAYHAIGALGVIELTAPTRVGLVNEGLKRLDIEFETRKYFQLHATLDIEHSKAWNEEVLYPLVKEDPSTMQPLAEGALMRLACGASCFEQYRRHFGLARLH
ncbi:MAG TPA: iron-containing redox enzyme family protein [Methylophilaceae bacterium]|nr:iron-containing redox enzyme family protein [Methylophilaceae bacterium]